MSFKVSLSNDVKKLLSGSDKNGIIGKVRKDFSKRGPIKVKQAIIKDMIKGISPVNHGGKYKKYSDSYKQEIRDKRSKKIRLASPTKSISPVNLRLSGGMHNSLKSFMKGKVLVVQFKSFLADIHNRLGAGKSRVKRRLLPTNSGEKFNRNINKVILSELKKSIDKVAKTFSGQ